jgi:MFS family permease
VTEPVARFRSRSPRRDITLLLLGNLVSAAGDMAAYVALVLRVRGAGSGWVSAVIAAEFLSPVLAAPVAGVIVDRFESRRVLLMALAGQAIVMLVLSMVADAAVTVGLVGMLGCLSAFTRPATGSLIPRIVGQEDAARGYSRLATGTTIGWVVGPAIGGVLTAQVGVRLTLLVDAISFLFLWLCALGISARRPRVTEQQGEPAAREKRGLSAGFHLIFHDAVLRVALPVTALATGAAVADNVAAPFRFVNQLHAGASGFGVYETVWALGALGGVQILGLRRSKGRAEPLLAVGNLVMGLGIAGIGWATNYGTALAAAVLGGAGNGMSNVGESAVIQSRTPEELLGRAFSASQALMQSAIATGTIVAAPAVAHLGASSTMILFGLLAAASAGLGLTAAASRR